jgi:hypothetical protein
VERSKKLRAMTVELRADSLALQTFGLFNLRADFWNILTFELLNFPDMELNYQKPQIRQDI